MAFSPLLSLPPERLCGFAERLRARETDVVEQVRFFGQFAECRAPAAARRPQPDQP
jgi:hypothetical protein